MKTLKISGILAVCGLLVNGLAIGDWFEHDDDDEHGGNAYRYGFSRQDITPMRNEEYRKECGACHFAYQPGLLPAASWRSLMDNLTNHFDENAELDAATRQRIGDYLVNNAADRTNAGRSPGIANSLRGRVPLRITDTPYFRRQHHEIPARMVEDNPDVGSFSRCDACHTRAGDGNYNEHSVRIPGWGRWED